MILPKVFCGPAILDHCLQCRNTTVNTKIKKELVTEELVRRLHEAIIEGHRMLEGFREPGACCGSVRIGLSRFHVLGSLIRVEKEFDFGGKSYGKLFCAMIYGFPFCHITMTYGFCV